MPLSDHEQSILDGVAAGLIVVERNRAIARWNSWMVSASRRAAADVTGKTLAEVFPDAKIDRILRAIESALAGGASTLLTNALHPELLPLQTRTGRPLLHDVVVAPLPGDVPAGCLVHVIDVTESTRRERYLRDRHNARYYALVESAPDVILNIDGEGIIRLANAAASRHFGYSADELVGQTAARLFEPESAWLDIGHAFRSGSASTSPVEVRVRLKDGRLRYFELSAAAWKDGSRTFTTAILRDVEDRRAAEAALRDSERQSRANERALAELNEALQESTRQLRAMDRRKNEFLATLAHELRNPLAPIANGLQLLKITKDDPVALERTRHMMDLQLRQMVRLIDDLLDVGRISNDRLTLNKELTTLDRVIRQAIETSSPLIYAQQHTLSIDLPPHELALEADAVRLTQVFANLLNNAAKYTPARGNIVIKGEERDGLAIVRVIDNGIGIPRDFLPQVFEMFVQVDKSLERTQGGLGIGLSLVKRLVEMHGGTVEAVSRGPNLGSEFIVRLPLTKARAPAADATAEPKPAPGHNRRRILVVDDNKDAAVTLALLLGMLGHDTRTAYDGLEAIEVAREFRPEVVLLDIGMPRLNGYDTARRLRGEPWGREMLLVALSGWGQDADRLKSSSAGFDIHLVKPVDVAEIQRLLARGHMSSRITATGALP
ncbi:MAG TPA: ATP-binding protein [Gammaproteobacteria bacterium]|nr:ATP-binding protein [Gammaproteobacteria bacterium]